MLPKHPALCELYPSPLEASESAREAMNVTRHNFDEVGHGYLPSSEFPGSRLGQTLLHKRSRTREK